MRSCIQCKISQITLYSPFLKTYYKIIIAIPIYVVNHPAVQSTICMCRFDCPSFSCFYDILLWCSYCFLMIPQFDFLLVPFWAKTPCSCKEENMREIVRLETRSCSAYHTCAAVGFSVITLRSSWEFRCPRLLPGSYRQTHSLRNGF